MSYNTYPDYRKRHPFPDVVVLGEGIHDLHFLRHAARQFHLVYPELPDLAAWEAAGRTLLIPAGGSGWAYWASCLGSWDQPAFCLLDREAGAAAVSRLSLAERLNAHPHLRAFVTRKRALENYLHPAALAEIGEFSLAAADDVNLPQELARKRWTRRHPGVPWDAIPPRGRRRLETAVKKRLSVAAVPRMTAQRLIVSDPYGEWRLWLEAVAALAALGRNVPPDVAVTEDANRWP